MIKHVLKLIWNKKRSNALMILEIFLSFIVLFFVMAYIFFNMERVNTPLGFATEDRWVISLDNIDQKDSLDALACMTNLQQNLLALDEVEEISSTQSIMPFIQNQWRTGNDDNGFPMNSLVVPSDINLAKLLDIKLIDGRWFEEADLTASVTPLIVNKNFIDNYYPDKSMVDSIIKFDGDRRIIGIVEEYRYMGEFSEPDNVAFILNGYEENMDALLLKLTPGISTAFEEKLSNLVKTTTKTTGSTIDNLENMRKEDSRESWLMLIALLSICGFLCLNVALGLFGVLWYNINKRKAEIGLRQAVGAHGSDISLQFILEILILTGFALAIGIFFAVQIPILQVTEYPNALFYKAIIYATLIILTLVLLCALFPSFQAARIKPATSLHED